MYLQKYEEYFGGEKIGSYENGELDKTIVFLGFMIVDWKSPSHVIKSSPEITIRKEKGQKFVNCAVISVYFNNQTKLSTDSLWKIKEKHLKKTKREIILNKVKTLKEILFQRYKICFSEAATETCSGK